MGSGKWRGFTARPEDAGTKPRAMLETRHDLATRPGGHGPLHAVLVPEVFRSLGGAWRHGFMNPLSLRD